MRIEAAFEKAGILFISDDEIAGICVRLAKKKRGRVGFKPVEGRRWRGGAVTKAATNEGLAGEKVAKRDA
jgi:hypothetical protein